MGWSKLQVESDRGSLRKHGQAARESVERRIDRLYDRELCRSPGVEGTALSQRQGAAASPLGVHSSCDLPLRIPQAS